ncbi:hypothetical protein H0H92_003151 [Tricholoma furcatifolium]|nr:hypothetical protein H0H92_003151 [Tricholoma furcatifolium]
MASHSLQPSEYDIQREVEALRDIRRRSVTPGALTIDLDLPVQSPPSSPTAYRLTTTSDESSSDSASGSATSGSSEGPPQTPNNQSNDPFPLFKLWVPASVHPEIAPAEFRAFLKEHARLSPTSEDGSPSLDRSDSLSSASSASGLGRKKSMLSRQYRPHENDGVENEQVVPLRRNRSTLSYNQGPQFSIDDLQKLEELAEEASVSDDPSRLRDVLRRSLSMNVSPSAISQMNEMPDIGDEADAPIIVPPPGQILRRAARTKIRKPGLPGDGGGHRFGAGASRRKPTRSQTAPSEPRTSDVSSSDNGESVESGSVERRSMPFSDEGSSQRPESFSEETSIFDAYVREDDEEAPSPAIITSSPPSTQIDLPDEPQPLLSSGIQPELLEALGPVIHHPQPQRLLSPPQPSPEQQPSRTPSPPEPLSPAAPEPLSPAAPEPLSPAAPEPPSPAAPERPPLVQGPPPSFLSTTPSPPPPSRKEKEKDKKGLFGKWGSDKSGKKAKQKDLESKERSAEKEKESGFFGSLFGSKKKQDEGPPPLLSPGHTGRETAQALLGAPKSRSPVSPGLAPGLGPNNYSRYPIHVERAIYRLSHIKLANPRRPLYEQVLISNLMFWYLGVIHKAQNPQPSPAVQGPQSPTGSTETHHTDEAEAEREREQQEQRQRAEREKQEKERLEREMEMKKKESGRKGSLTKAPPPGVARRAETPVRGPQYEMQHREMQQEYHGYPNGVSQQGGSMHRSASAPVLNPNGQQQYARSPQPALPTQLQPISVGEQFYYSPDNMQKPQQPRLPPGAMSPEQQMWNQQQQGQQRHSPSPPSSPVNSRSGSPPGRTHGRYNPNPSQDHVVANGSEHRMPGRSLSATAIPTQSSTANGKMRKVTSAHAALPPHQNGANGEEEDIPLAVWQQQRRR